VFCRAALLSLFWLLIPCSGFCAEFSALVTDVTVSKQNQQYVISADIDYPLSTEAKLALKNGVPLYWILQIKVLQQRSWVWNKTLQAREIRYRIQYNALLNMYRVRNEDSGEISNFSSLSAALGLMSALRNLPVIDEAEIDPEQSYQIAIKATFDRDALPLPLRPIAYTNPQWFLSSDWTLWPLVK